MARSLHLTKKCTNRRVGSFNHVVQADGQVLQFFVDDYERSSRNTFNVLSNLFVTFTIFNTGESRKTSLGSENVLLILMVKS